jgi:hypothetical protein
MITGRPPLWESPDEIENIINEYFENTSEDEITLSGLCIALKTNKQTISNYQDKPEFKHILEMAKLKIENAYEKSLRKHGRSGDIFALKNFGWTDRQEINHSGDLNLHKDVQKEIQDTFTDELKAHNEQNPC